MKKKYIFIMCLPMLFLGLATGCSDDATIASDEEEAAEPAEVVENIEPDAAPAATPSAISPDLTPGAIQATITMEDGSTITVELYPDIAPQSVRNFVYLANQGFYNGTRFHRIIENFMIQGGCPLGTGTGNAGYFIKGEFSHNGHENNLLHTRGVLSMARGREYDTAGSQFFIVHGDSPHLDGGYAAFGRVIAGMNVVDAIALTPNSGPNGAVARDLMPVIRTITIDSDVDLPPPDKIT